MKLNKKMLKIRFELNGCTHVKILLVKYKVKQEKLDRRFGLVENRDGHGLVMGRVYPNQ